VADYFSFLYAFLTAGARQPSHGCRARLAWPTGAAHEGAHQWWGLTLSLGAIIRDQWFSEAWQIIVVNALQESNPPASG